MRYKETSSRDQLSLFNSLEDLVSDHNAVRLIDALLDRLSQKDPVKFEIDKGNKSTGRKAYSPVLLSKLFLYGYLNRIASSRRLEQETHRNIEMMWLINNEHPDHKTIADFRKDNAPLIRFVTTSFRRFLKESGFIKGETQAYDGTKLKAYTKKEVLTLKGVVDRLTHLEKEIEEYLTRMEKVDSLESIDEQVSERELAKCRLEAQIGNLQAEVHQLEHYKKSMEDKDQTSYCLNDPDARLMPSRDGWIPAYNVQVGVDEQNRMISSAEVTTLPNDLHALEDNVKATEEQLGQTPKVVIADMGYGNTEQMENVESNEITTCYIPLEENNNSKRDKDNGLNFTYDAERDVVVCSQGETLYPLARNVNKSGQRFNTYHPKKGVCSRCPKFGVCTKSPKGRIFHVGERLQYKNNCMERQQTKEFNEVFRKRKGMVEHPFGTLKLWMGKIPLLLRSRKKVQIEIDLYATAYNLRRLLNLQPMSELMRMVAAY